MSEPKKGPGILGYALSLGGVSEFKAGFKDANGAIEGTEKAADSAGKTFSSMLGKAAAIAAPIASVMAFRKAWQGAMGDLAAMGKLKTRLNPAGDAIKSIDDDIGKLQMTVGMNDAELSGLANTALDAGVAETNLMDVMMTSAKNATGSYQDLGSMIQGTQAILNQFGQEAGTVNDVQNMLFVGTKSGAGEVNELAQAVAYLGPTVKASKVSVQELIALSAFFGKRGLGGNRAMAQVGGILASLEEVNKDKTHEANRLGIAWSTNAVRAMGFTQWVQHVNEKLEAAAAKGNDTTKSLKALGLEAKGLGMFSMLAKDAAEYNDILGRINSREDELGRLWAEKQDSVGVQTKRLEQVQGEMWDSFGNGLIKGVAGTNVLNDASDVLLGKLGALETAGKSFGEALGKGIEWAVSENGLPRLIDLTIKAATLVGKVLGPIISTIDFLSDPDLQKYNRGQERVVPFEEGGKVYYATEAWDKDSATWKRVKTNRPHDQIRNIPEADTSGKISYRQEEFNPDTGKWQGRTAKAPDVAAALTRGGLAAMEEFVNQAGPSLAREADSAVMAGPAKPAEVELKILLEQQLKLGKDLEAKKISGTAKMAGAGDANMHASYRMTYIREGDGILEVKPLPTHVLMSTRRPAKEA